MIYLSSYYFAETHVTEPLLSTRTHAAISAPRSSCVLTYQNKLKPTFIIYCSFTVHDI